MGGEGRVWLLASDLLSRMGERKERKKPSLIRRKCSPESAHL